MQTRMLGTTGLEVSALGVAGLCLVGMASSVATPLVAHLLLAVSLAVLAAADLRR